MNFLSKILLLAALSALSLSALAVPAYTLIGNGSVTGSYPSFTLIGSDLGGNTILGENFTFYTETFTSATQLSFSWTYETFDDTGASFDKAGYVNNGVFKQLSVDDWTKGISHTGTESVTVAANTVFGWYVHSFDQFGGAGQLKVDVNAVPEPASIALLVSGLLGFGATRRKQKTA